MNKLMRTVYALLSALILIGLSSCSNRTDSSQGEEQKVGFVFRDALGREVVLEQTPSRVAVLLGSFAEIWVLSGGEDSLVAVTQDAFDERGLELGTQVQNLGESHNPSLEGVFAAEPDLVILSADLEGHLALKSGLEAAGIPSVWCKVELFEDYLALLDTFTRLLDTPELYEKNGLQVKVRVDEVISAAPSRGEGSSILLLRAYSGGVKAKNSDNTAGVMLRDLGCVNIADSDSNLLEELQIESILAADPEYIFVTTMGTDPAKALANLQALFDSDPAWQSLTAVKQGRVHVLDKNLFHYKPNVRWGESYEILAGILYPKQ